MRKKIKPSTNFGYNRTVSSTGTESLGWLADALVPCFLLVT
jgi:hypothetical protein